MPYSFNFFDTLISQCLEKLKPNHLVDVSPGAGKYLDLCRQSSPQTKVEAIEVNPAYAEKFQLAQRYDKVVVNNGFDELMSRVNDESAACYSFGDVLEHMPKSNGIDLLNHLYYRASWIFVILPETLSPGRVQDPHDSHIAIWRQNDFSWCPHIFVREHHHAYSAVLIPGLLAPQHSIGSLFNLADDWKNKNNAENGQLHFSLEAKLFR